jgi:hypothetical protein
MADEWLNGYMAAWLNGYMVAGLYGFAYACTTPRHATI